MDTPEYPSNNQQDPPVETTEQESEKKPEKNLDSVIEGKAVTKKKSRLGESFEHMWKYVTMDVLLPAAKDMVSDAVAQGVDQLLFGESRGGGARRRSNKQNQGYISYNRYTPAAKKAAEPTARRQISDRTRANHAFDDIILDTRNDAEAVLDRLYDLVGQFDIATVSDLYALIGVKSKYTDEAWGWTDMRGAQVRRVRSGYLLDIPAPEFLD